MPQVTNTYDTYDAIGQREELADTIYDITPEDTPFMTLIGRMPVKTTHPEWQTDALATPASNAQIEGTDWSYQALDSTERVGNYTQIADKRIVISRTLEHTDKAGRKSEMKRELKKKGVELKKDMEYSLLMNQASAAGSSTVARKLGSFPAWLTTNVSRDGGGADGGFNSGTGIVDAETTGTLRAFTMALMNDVIELNYKNGGNPRTLMMSPYNKRVFSGFAGISDLRSDLNGKKQATIYGGADSYVSDFGTMSVLVNRVMATDAGIARRVFSIDPSMAKVGIFDDIQLHKPGKTGDAEKRVLNVEYTLIVKNEAAHGAIADVFGLTAST